MNNRFKLSEQINTYWSRKNLLQSNIEILIASAELSFKNGDITHALSVSQSILNHHPGHPEATLILGASLIKKDEFKKSVKLFEKARKKITGSPALYYNLGIGYLALKNHRNAIKAFKKCINMGMTGPDIYNQLAHSYTHINKIKTALEFYIKSLNENSNQPLITIKVAKLFIHTKQNNNAIKILTKPIDLSDELIQIHEQRLALLKSLGQKKSLEKHAQSLLDFDPHNAVANSTLAELYEDNKKLDLAVLYYLNSAKSYFIRQDIKNCEKFIDKAARLADSNELILEDIGVLYMRLEKYDKAVFFLEKALSFSPVNPDFNFNIGILFLEKYNIKKSIEALSLARDLKPDFLPCYLQLAKAYQLNNEFEKSLECYNQCISIDEHHPSAHFNRAQLMLAYGKISESWVDYEWRIEADTALSYLLDPRDTSATLPKPSSVLKEKNWRQRPFVLLNDQGLGDILFFLRFAPAMISSGIKFHMIMPDKIRNIINHSKLNCTDIENIQDIPEDGILLSDSDLPLFYGTISSKQTPAPLALNPEVERVNNLKTTLAQAGKPPYIAVTWEAGTRSNIFENSLHKYIDPYLLGKILSNTEATIINIQRNPEAAEIEKFHQGLGRRSIDYTETNEDLDDMLALLSIVDDYIGVSNTNMHLRAGLQKTARILVPIPGEWRWMDNGNQSPWFPDFKVYRESIDDSWEHALEALQQDFSEDY